MIEHLPRPLLWCTAAAPVHSIHASQLPAGIFSQIKILGSSQLLSIVQLMHAAGSANNSSLQ